MSKSFLVSVLILFCTVLLETAVLSNISFLPAVPDLLLIVSVFLSLVNGRGFGVSAGFVSGLLLDFMTGSPFGFNCLLRALIGYLTGLLSETINYSGIFMSAFIVFIATAVKVLLTATITLFYPNISVSYSIFSLVFIFELASNVILTPFVFKFLHCFDRSVLLKIGDFN